jgi:hypothetical protein
MLIQGSHLALAAGHYENQVVSLSVTWQSYNTYRPWDKNKPGHRTAQAIVVGDTMLLTTAHAVTNATFIQVKKHGKPSQTAAQIYHMDREINLALLTVSAPEFFDDLEAVSLSQRVVSGGEAQSVRWKKRQLEVAQTRLGRVEVVASRTGYVQHAVLKGTTDLSGASAVDPVFMDDNLIGLTVYNAKGMVEILPSHTLTAYCKMAKSGDYRGFATLSGLSYQGQNDETVAKWLGLQGPPRGILVRNSPYGETGHTVLKPLDLVLSMDGHAIDSHGYYRHPRYGQLHFFNIITERHMIGDRVKVSLLRAGKLVEVEMPLLGFPLKKRLIPYWRSDYTPSYLVAGGLVFRELDYNYLRGRGNNWRSKANTRLVLAWDLDRFNQSPERRRIIILSHVLPDTYNIGYHDLRDLIVHKVNGLPVNSMAQLKEAFEHPLDIFHIIEFQKNYTRDKVVLDAGVYEAATQRILENYNVPKAKVIAKE